jgi:hypothetical protein
MSQSQGIEVRRVSRRTIAAGAAWAVPVIAVGAAAPAMASSVNEPPVFELDPEASCKYPGQSFGQFNYGYNLVFNVTAPTTGTLCITDITVPNGTAEILLVQTIDGDGNSQCTSIPAGTSQIRIVVGSSNSANGTGTFTGSFNGTTGTFAATFSEFHPCARP